MFLEFQPVKNRAIYKTSLEEVCSRNLGMSFDYDGELTKNIVLETYKSFFEYSQDGHDVYLHDISSGGCQQNVITGFVLNKEYHVCGSGFHIKTTDFNYSMKQIWDIIGQACNIYLGLDDSALPYVDVV